MRLLRLLLLFGAVTLRLGAEEKKVTFSADVAPVVYKECSSCHREGQAAPFALTNFEEVKKRARQIVRVTEERIMPPWHADPVDVEYAHDRHLSQDEIAVFRRWLEAGLPRGNPKEEPSLPNFAKGWQLGEPDFVATMPEAFPIPAEGPDIYRNFVLPLGLEEDTWVNGIELRPGDPTAVHHILYYLDTRGSARREAEKNEDGQPGYDGMGRGNGGFRFLGGWDVGTDASRLPYGLAWKIPAGADLVVQIHYHPTGRATEDASSLGFFLAEGPSRQPWSLIPLPTNFGILQGIRIPAGETDHVEKTSMVLPTDCRVFGVGAHAHLIAKTFEMTATSPEGTVTRLLSISDWDFNWQEDYRFQEPLTLTKGTRLDVRMSYDNSEQNSANPNHPPKEIFWGPGSADEMGTVTLQAIFESDADRKATNGALRRHLLGQYLDRMMEQDWETLEAIHRQVEDEIPLPDKRLFPVIRLGLLLLDQDQNGKLEGRERELAITRIEQQTGGLGSILFYDR